VLLALSTGQKTGLLIAAGVFIGFALASSFLFPRRDPDFPGRRGLGTFVTVTLALFIGMMAAIYVLAREDEAEGVGHEAAAETGGTGTGGTETGGTETGGTETGGTETGGAAEGDAAAGKAVFTSAGCGSCHTLADAGSNGQVGPNLDEAKPSYELAVTRVTNGMPPMPSFKDQLSEEKIRDVAAYVSESAGT
jgi:cytochrome c553